MKKAFLDTNIILDYLMMRHPNFQDAEELFTKADEGKVALFASALSFNVIFYVLRKNYPKPQLFQILSDLTRSLTITGVDASVIQNALNSGFADFEDAIQYFSALHFGGIDAIVTNNVKDFFKSSIPVFSPADFLAALP